MMRQHRWAGLTLAMVLAFCLGAAAQAPEQPAGDQPAPRAQSETVSHVVTPGGTHIYTEYSGLTILVKENHFAPVVSVRVVVGAGSMLEGEYLGSGISHLTEHLVHGGTTSARTEDEYRKMLDELGGNSNAAASVAWTTYFISTTADETGTAIRTLAQWLTDASITQKEFDREHAVVTRELERGEDSMERRLHQLASLNAVRVHPSRYAVIGCLPQLKALTRDDVVKYYHRRYVPNNILVAVVGAVEAAQVHELAAKAFAGAQRHVIDERELPQEPAQVAFREMVDHAPVEITRMRMDFSTVTLTDKDMYPLDVLSFVLSQGESSRLVRELRDRRQLVSAISTWSSTPSYVEGSFTIYAQTQPGREDEVRQAVWEELKRAMTVPVTPQELAQAKTQKISELVFGTQTAEEQASDLALNYQSVHDPDFSKKYVDRIQKVTAPDIMRVARQYFRQENETLTILAPEPKATAPGKTATSAPLEGQAEKFDLANGMRVILKRNASVPAVSMQAFFLGGLRSDVPGKNGVARMTADLLVRGTTTRSADWIARSFESMGGQIGSTSGNNTFYVTASVLADGLDPGLAVLADVVRNPSFPGEELARQKQLTLAVLARQQDSVPTLASLFFRKTLYPHSVYGLNPLGTPETVKAMTRQDLVGFYKHYARPQNCVLAIYGDIDVQKTLALVRQHFGSWVMEPAEIAAPVVEPLAAGPVVVSQKLDETKQTAVVWIGYRTMKVTDVADRDAITVLGSVMSGYGYPGGWLYEELRGKGLVYEVYAFDASYLDTGYFGAYAVCQPAKVPEVTAVMMAAIARAREGRITEEELKLAKSRIVTTELLQNQTNGSQAMDAAVNELYGLGYRFGDSLKMRTEAVTAEDLKRVAVKYFREPVIAVTTPEPELTKSIDSFGQ